MAGDWIKMRCNLGSDPRVLLMADALGLPELHVVGLLWRFWSWADQHAESNAVGVTEALVDRITCPGFAAQLRAVGWLEVTDAGIILPNYEEHNGQTAKQRAVTQRRVRRFRCNGASVTGALPEKRREEKRREDTNTDVGKSDPQFALEADPQAETRAAVAAPTSDAEWLEGLAKDPAYTGIDVKHEHAKATRWCLEHRKQLTRRRFVNWLNRCERPLVGSAPKSGTWKPTEPDGY